VQVGVHARLEYRDAAQLAELSGVCFVIEGTGDQHIEAGIACLAGRGNKVGPRDCAEFGAYEYRGAIFIRSEWRVMSGE